MNRLYEPWSIGRLARTVGLSRRTLHRAVQREFGRSPMSLLRDARLKQPRLQLDAPRPGATVTDVALDCGFTHLGRFSSEYRRLFGEHQLTTARRTRWT